MNAIDTLGVDQQRLDQLCRRYGIKNLFVFGSVAHGRATESNTDSDVDLLYELQPDAHLGWEIEELSDALVELFGRPVELVSRRAVNPHLRDAVLRSARTVYAASS